jgi:hypothetical protein
VGALEARPPPSLGARPIAGGPSRSDLELQSIGSGKSERGRARSDRGEATRYTR